MNYIMQVPLHQNSKSQLSPFSEKWMFSIFYCTRKSLNHKIPVFDIDGDFEPRGCLARVKTKNILEQFEYFSLKFHCKYRNVIVITHLRIFYAKFSHACIEIFTTNFPMDKPICVWLMKMCKIQ